MPSIGEMRRLAIAPVREPATAERYLVDPVTTTSTALGLTRTRYPNGGGCWQLHLGFNAQDDTGAFHSLQR